MEKAWFYFTVVNKETREVKDFYVYGTLEQYNRFVLDAMRKVAKEWEVPFYEDDPYGYFTKVYAVFVARHGEPIYKNWLDLDKKVA